MNISSNSVRRILSPVAPSEEAASLEGEVSEQLLAKEAGWEELPVRQLVEVGRVVEAPPAVGLVGRLGEGGCLAPPCSSSGCGS